MCFLLLNWVRRAEYAPPMLPTKKQARMTSMLPRSSPWRIGIRSTPRTIDTTTVLLPVGRCYLGTLMQTRYVITPAERHQRGMRASSKKG